MGWPIDTYLVSPEHKFIYVPIPKVACSSIKAWMIRVHGLPGLDKGEHEFCRHIVREEICDIQFRDDRVVNLHLPPDPRYAAAFVRLYRNGPNPHQPGAVLTRATGDRYNGQKRKQADSGKYLNDEPRFST